MQEFGSGRIGEKVDEVPIAIGGEDFRRQVDQHPVEAGRMMVEAEIDNRFF